MIEVVSAQWQSSRQPGGNSPPGQGEEEAMMSAAICRGNLPQSLAFTAGFAWMTARTPRSTTPKLGAPWLRH